MKELKPGDRVRVYAADDEGPVEWIRTVVKVDGACVIVEDERGCRSFWHRKQVRKLVNKERQHIVLSGVCVKGCPQTVTVERAECGHEVALREFVEVRRRDARGCR